MISEKDCIVSDDRRLSEISTSSPEQDNPSIKKMFSFRREERHFKFHSVSENEVRKVILNMNGKKANLIGDIPAGILKGCVDFYISALTKILNTSLERGCFPNQLKLAEVTAVFKKEDELNKSNYRPVSVLSHASQIFERSLQTNEPFFQI